MFDHRFKKKKIKLGVVLYKKFGEEYTRCFDQLCTVVKA